MRSAILLLGAFTTLLALRSSSAQTVGFEQTSFTVLEGESVEVCITLLGDVTGPGPFDFSIIALDLPGEAEEFSDYNLQGRGSLIDGGADVMLNATTTRGCITIDISYDQTSELAEFLTLSLESRNSGSNITLNPRQTVVTILNNNVSIGYEQAAYSVREGDNVTVCASVMSGVLSRSTSITSSVVPGTALGLGTDFPDYTLQGNTIIYTFSSSVSRQCTTIQTLDDSMVAESPESFSLALSQADVILTQDSTNVTILPCADGDIRLVGGETESEGRVEICFSQIWGTVCDDSWDSPDASVVCRQLGFSSSAEAVQFAAFGQGVDPIYLDDVMCTGSESNLANCTHRGIGVEDCSHSEDAGVRCFRRGNCSDGALQLVGGETVSEGRVEICMDGVVGTVCDVNWDNSDAIVVCRQLGFAPQGAMAVLSAGFGQGSGPILLRSVGCTGFESNVANCSNDDRFSCTHSNDAGVRCLMNCPEGMFLCPDNRCIAGSLRCDGIPDCTNGADEQSCEACTDGVRLNGVASPTDGQVDVCVDGIYSSICATSAWGVEEASVVCRQLGLQSAGIPLSFSLLAAFGVPLNVAVSSSQPFEVTCSGTEERIQDCQLVRVLQCSSRTIAGVNCTAPQNCVDGDLQLVGGPSNREGRVEMCYRGVWGAISDLDWNNQDAAVTCRQLGFEPSGALPISPAVYGGSPAPVLFDRPMCFGDLQDRLIDCSFTNLGSEPVTNPSRLVGVQCEDYPRSTNCTEGDVRLTYRVSNSIGQVEVCVGNTWNAVCRDIGWGLQEADIVCRQLEFVEPPRGTNRPDLRFGTSIQINQSLVPVLMSNFDCLGFEPNLLDITCRFGESKRQTQNPCRNPDAAVTCVAPPRIILEPPSSDRTYTVEAGRNFVLTCEVDPFAYLPPMLPISVFRVVGNMTELLPVEVLTLSVPGPILLPPDGERAKRGGREGTFTQRYVVLRSTSVRPEDAGEYRCVVNNSVQQTEVNITVNVQVSSDVGSTSSIRFSVPSRERNNITQEMVITTTNNLVLSVVSGTPGTSVNCSFIASREIDIQRGLERIECVITNSFSSVDVVALAQRAAVIITRTNPVFALPIVSGICLEETTGFFLWPPTPPGTTRSLPCPNTTTIVNRTCNPPGIWEGVDLTLCIPISSINTDNITVDNYEELITSVSGAVRGAATSEQEQTTDNLATVADVFARSASLVSNNTIIREETVQELVRILEGLQQWNVDVLETNSSNIVQSFEAIVSTFAQQPRNETFVFMTETILFVAELIDQTELATNGRSFSSSNLTGTANPITLSASETAAAFLPASLFQLITDRDDVGIFFAVYDAGVLFPITNDTQRNQETNSSITTVVGSPVLAATVGPGLNFVGLVEPVRILLRLNEELENVSSGQPQCVSWNFTLQNWTTEGCETVLSEGCDGVMKEGCVVTCNCNHLTNFAILVDICSRFQDCQPSGPLRTALEVLTIIGAVLSLIGIVATIITLLLFKKLRERDATKYHIQLCIALFCMLMVFVCGINRTSVYGGCVAVSALIHYFTLVAVMWMGAEAVLMFQKLVIVFVRITTNFIIAVSLVCWLVPIIPVIIPLAVDLSDAVSTDLVVRRDTSTQPGFCFISDVAVFFGAFLGPIFAILLFNVVMFVLVIGVLIRHSRNTLGRSKEQVNKKTTIRLLISITGVMFLFGLTWLFGALTITGFGDSRASTAFQVLFVILNAFQGFFIFLFFCVFSKDARESWMEVFTCGRYQSKFLHPSQAKYASTTAQKKSKTASTNLATSNLGTSALPSTTFNSSTDDLGEETSSKIPLASTAKEEKKEKVTFKGSPEVHETDIDNDQKVDLGSPQKSDSKEEHGSPSQWREDGIELKARVKRYSTKKTHTHHVESAEVDFSDSDSGSNDEPDDPKA